MNVCSVEFLGCLALVAIALPLLRGAATRRLALSLINLAFLFTLVPNPQSWACFALVIAGTYGILVFLKARPSPLALSAAVVAVVAGFLVLKRYSFLWWVLPPGLWSHPVEMVGISYILFKFIHVAVDVDQGQLEPRG